jgi:hypothetical protein
MGSIKMRRFVPPWGKIYFVLEGPLLEFALPGGQTRLTAFINARSTGSKQPKLSTGEAVDPLGGGPRACIVLGAAGFVASLVRSIWFPHLGLHPIPGKSASWWIVYDRIMGTTTQWPWDLVSCGVLILAILLLRFRHRAYFLAFALGAYLALVLVGGWKG